MPERQHHQQPDPQANAENTGSLTRPLTREDARAIARVLYAVHQRRAAREAAEAKGASAA